VFGAGKKCHDRTSVLPGLCLYIWEMSRPRAIHLITRFKPVTGFLWPQGRPMPMALTPNNVGSAEAPVKRAKKHHAPWIHFEVGDERSEGCRMRIRSRISTA